MNKVITVVWKEGDVAGTITERPLTPEEEANRVQENIKYFEREERMKTEAQVLECDICGKSMGMSYNNDLNGSRFYHSECI